MKRVVIFFICLFILPIFQSLQAAGEESLTLSIEDIKSDEGKIYYTVFESKKGFPNKPELAVKQGNLTITDGRATVTIDNLPEGTYAVSVYHDKDNNGEMKTNLIGMPKEGVGNSNNIKGRPNFKKSSFSLSGKTAVVIKMYYP